MNCINRGRVLLGGVVAAIVMIFSGVLLTAIFFDRAFIEHIVQSMNLQLRPPGVFAAYLAGGYLLLSLVIVWLYAAMRPRFGAGPKTAIMAGLVVWIVANPAQSVLIGLIAQLPTGFVVKSMAMYLVMMVCAALAGAALYKESPASSAASVG